MGWPIHKHGSFQSECDHQDGGILKSDLCLSFLAILTAPVCTVKSDLLIPKLLSWMSVHCRQCMNSDSRSCDSWRCGYIVYKPRLDLWNRQFVQQRGSSWVLTGVAKVERSKIQLARGILSQLLVVPDKSGRGQEHNPAPAPFRFWQWTLNFPLLHFHGLLAGFKEFSEHLLSKFHVAVHLSHSYCSFKHII